jgi:hypothetical protein
MEMTFVPITGILNISLSCRKRAGGSTKAQNFGGPDPDGRDGILRITQEGVRCNIYVTIDIETN